MKRVMILSFAAALLATGCTSKSTVKTPGIDLSNLDTTVACGDDFYDYACGGWMKKNPLKPEYARFGSFDQLRENNREQIRLLFEELGKQKAEPGSIAQKIGDLYNMGLDSVRLNEEGASPIAEELSRIQSLSGKEAISAMIGEIRTYRAINREKEFYGILSAYDENTVTIKTEDGTEMTFEKSDIALIRLAFDF